MIGTHRFQNGSLVLVKNKSTAHTWFFRFYEEVEGRRVYRKLKVGSVRQLPHRRDAEKAVLALRSKINSDTRSPETVNELITHYKKFELVPESGRQLPLNNGSVHSARLLQRGQRFRNIMSALLAHAKRYEMVSAIPIEGVAAPPRG